MFMTEVIAIAMVALLISPSDLKIADNTDEKTKTNKNPKTTYA